jgi:hypothetical protein
MKYKQIPETADFITRFEAKLNEIKTTNTQCWNWKWRLSSQGYGTTSMRDKVYLCHRVSYFYFYGRQPKLVIDHICCNRRCINPKHLQEVSILQNVNLDKERFPQKYKRKNTTTLPKMLVEGFCTHGHAIKNMGDMYFTGTQLKCRICNKSWQRTSRERRARLKGMVNY